MSKVLSVRLNEDDEQRLAALAEDLDVGPSVLARMLIHSSLSGLAELQTLRERGRFPLSLLSEILAPAAQAEGVSEEDLNAAVTDARRRLWDEHYAESS
jgi:predicted transcriptional regulator